MFIAYTLSFGDDTAMPCVKCFKQSKKLAKKTRKVKSLVKKVTFNADVTIIYFEKIIYDSSICWERAARDRMRFNRRIIDTEQRIAWVFTSQHREHMYTMLNL